MTQSTGRSSRNTGISAQRKRAHSSPPSSPSQSPQSSTESAESSTSSTSPPPPRAENGSISSNRKKRRSTHATTDTVPFPSTSVAGQDSQNTQRASRGPTTQRRVPAFLNKLYNMVQDPSTDNLITWSESGKSFIVERHEQFAKTVLPRFYKHNTFASFVRQLNMYDFHKIPHIEQGALVTDRHDERWEFSNPNFCKDRPEALYLVTRKRNKDRSTGDADNVSLGSLVKEIAEIKKHQMSIDSDLRALQNDNDTLWQETLSAREKHQRHQEVIEKILQFLTIVFSNENGALNAALHQMNRPFMLGKNNEYIGLDRDNATVQGHGLGGPSNTPTVLIQEAAGIAGLSNAGTGSQEPRKTGESDSKDVGFSLDKLFSNDAGSDIPSDLTKFSQSISSASRSAKDITKDIDNLQDHIEQLAEDIGIDLSQFSESLDDTMCQFTNENRAMISGASRSDKISLFELAGGSHVRNKYDGNASWTKDVFDDDKDSPFPTGLAQPNVGQEASLTEVVTPDVSLAHGAQSEQLAFGNVRMQPRLPAYPSMPLGLYQQPHAVAQGPVTSTPAMASTVTNAHAGASTVNGVSSSASTSINAVANYGANLDPTMRTAMGAAATVHPGNNANSVAISSALSYFPGFAFPPGISPNMYPPFSHPGFSTDTTAVTAHSGVRYVAIPVPVPVPVRMQPTDTDAASEIPNEFTNHSLPVQPAPITHTQSQSQTQSSNSAGNPYDGVVSNTHKQ